MGKTIEASAADIIVFATGKLSLGYSEEGRDTSDSDKMVILGHLMSCIDWTMRGRKLWKEMIIDIIVAPDYVIHETGKEIFQIDIKIIATGEAAGIVKERETAIIKYLQKWDWIKNINFEYKSQIESILLEV